MTTKKEHKKVVDKTGKLKPKYRDIARFPKVQTNGYEKSFNDNYDGLIKITVGEILKKVK